MSKYQQESVNKILNELRLDQDHYQHLYKKYKKCYRVLLFLEFLCQTTNIASQSSALITLLTVTTIPVGILFNSLGIITGGIGVFCRQLNYRKTKLMLKNKELLKLSRHVERSIIGEYLNKENITTEDYNLILKLIDTYYQQRTDIVTKVSLDQPK